LWRVQGELAPVTSREAGAYLPPGVLEMPVVRIGEAFFLQDDRPAREAAPLLILVTVWSTDDSLADALQSIGATRWVSPNGRVATTTALLRDLPLRALSTSVDCVPCQLNAGYRTVLAAVNGEPLFAALDHGDGTSTAAELAMQMRAAIDRMEATALEAHALAC
jgi:hypothetical protein